MKRHTRLLLIVCALAALVTLSLLLAAPTAVGQSASAILPPEPDSQPPDVLSINKVEAPAVVFPPDPGWPGYAQREITVQPEPPILGQPTEICAAVVNTDTVPLTATLEFGVAHFGIGLDFTPIGARTIQVPPESKAKACVIWTPREPGHWCIQVLLKQGTQYPILRSQRNIDIWEAFKLDIPAVTVFPVRNNTGQTTDIQMSLVNLKPGWQAFLDPPSLPGMKVGDMRQVTLTVIPLALPLGTREPIVDVEAHDASGLLIGGFRKMDWPPVPLHRPEDPPYAESEIDVFPYPPLPGEPTNICVELRNLSNVTQTVDLGFDIANFGIGLPWTLIGQRTAEIPPFGKTKVCVTWIPPGPGHFCVQVHLNDPLKRYIPQWSQRNLDVNEILLPGVLAQTVLPIGNPNPFTTTIYLTATQVDSFFDVWLDVTTLPDMGPNEVRPVTLFVMPGQGPMPEDGTPVADVEAFFQNAQREEILIGGIRKIFRPPIPIHNPHEPPYGESEISIQPYPPRAGEPVVICAELRNPTPVTQTVNVEFGVANFGIGIPFVPIDQQVVEIPPFSKIKVCTTWVPPIGGHFCAQIILRQPGYRDVVSQRNMDVAEYLRPRTPDSYEFPVGNPFDEPITVTLGLVEHLPGWDVSLSDYTLPNLLPHTHQTVTMVVTPDDNLADLEDESPVVDVEAYVGDRLLGGFRKLFRPPIPIHHPDDPPYAEREISIEPYPPRAGEPTEICVELRNPTDFPQTIWVEFAWANFGIGLPFHPFHGQLVTLPPHSVLKKCTVWVPPFPGHFCVQVSLIDPDQRYRVMRSQRNMDVGEVFTPGQPTKPLVFRVGNPLTFTTNIEMAAFVHLRGWDAMLDPPFLPNMAPDETRPVTLTVFVPPGPLPPDDTPVVDVEAHAAGQLIGGFRKLFRPPIPIHHPEDPPYAEREISIEPYPPRAGEPTEICVELRNPTDFPQTIWVEFAWANFGIGLPFHPFHGQLVTLPPHSVLKKCTVWVPPFPGHFCVQVSLIDPDQRYRVMRSQRNMDVSEILIPGKPSALTFPVGNPTTGTVTVTLGLVPRLEWDFSLSQDVLPNMQPGDRQMVTLVVTRPLDAPEPEPDQPVVDVEGFVGGQLIGGFRKLYRPPAPIHRPQDPIYAESEISINPYPPREREPTEICVDVRNPTDAPQTITVTFAVANFGIGLPFHDIARPIAVTLPPNSIKRVCVTWVPPFGGHFCARVTLQLPGHEPVWSQRNMDVGEILIPGKPSALAFPVGNPTTRTMTVTLGLVPHLEWDVSLSQDVLPNMQPNETRMVTLTVMRPLDAPEPEPEQPVVDVEGFIGGQLIGGFRKVYRPPVPIHVPKDPPYAESEIFVDPYPTMLGIPTLLGVLVFNPTPATQQVTVSFSVANFGIGMPFTTTGIVSPTMVVTIPPFGLARAKTMWLPWLWGHFCVQVILQSPGHEPVRSQRNIDVGEPLNPDKPHSRIIEIVNPTTEAATITLGLINHRPNWQVELTPTVLTNVGPGVMKPVTLTVKPPSWEGLADEQPIADVEAYINGELIGGIRKIAKPPIPLHKPQDRPYAESEISVTPYPLQANRPATITTQIMNTSDVTQTIRVLFGVANYGIGITFTNTNIVPTMTVVTLGPGISTTVSAVWTPPFAGHWCIQIILEDPNDQYPPQRSQRNVEVERRVFKPCEPFSKDFLLQNSTPLTVTVSIGASAINLPPGWTYSTSITETTLGPFQSITVTVTITPPCGLAAQGMLTPLGALTLDTGGASGPPTIDVEGYINGELVGGVEIQLEADPFPYKIYLPVVFKQ